MNTTVPCVVCDDPLEEAMSGEPNHPLGATTFYSRGQYGSTVFDPMDHTYLEVNICDKCLLAAAEKKKVLRGYHVPAPRHLETWAPEEEKWETVESESDPSKPVGHE